MQDCGRGQCGLPGCHGAGGAAVLVRLLSQRLPAPLFCLGRGPGAGPECWEEGGGGNQLLGSHVALTASDPVDLL